MAVSGESHQVKHLRNPGNKKKEDRKGGGEGKKETRSHHLSASAALVFPFLWRHPDRPRPLTKYLLSSSFISNSPGFLASTRLPPPSSLLPLLPTKWWNLWREREREKKMMKRGGGGGGGEGKEKGRRPRPRQQRQRRRQRRRRLLSLRHVG